MKTRVEKGKLIIEIDTTVKRTPSKSGKMEMIASTQGFSNVGQTEDGRAVKVNLNCGVSA
jgi:hypothetical protein|tara:strand:+ start:1093 stop:1272 length:180 start_codon:yes stop_codon:yes gene_type:complete